MVAKLGAKPIFVAVSGGVFLYSGFKGLRLSTTIRDLVSGKNPSKDAARNAIDRQYNQGPNADPNKPIGLSSKGFAAATLPAHHVSMRNIYRLARDAGFSPSQAVIATAVAMAESSGDATNRCYNCVPGITEDSRGLWQINVDAHPQYSSVNLYDPAANAAAAYAISGHGRNFSPWTTYTSGAYKRFLGAAMGVAHG